MGNSSSFTSTKTPLEVTAERVLEKVKKMNQQELLNTFVDAGILTKKGNVKKPYREVLVNSSK